MSDLSIKEVIWQIVASVPQGRVATYGQIAALAGYPRHARYVGSVLKNLPPTTRLPWHRIVNAQGRIAFPVGSDAYLLQRARLEAEGVSFVNGKISLKGYGLARAGNTQR